MSICTTSALHACLQAVMLYEAITLCSYLTLKGIRNTPYRYFHARIRNSAQREKDVRAVFNFQCRG